MLDRIITNKPPILKLKISMWKSFSLSDLFSVERGTRLTKENRIPGDTPFATAGENNNGVSSYISNGDMQIYANVLTIDMFCNCFYHDYEFACDDNILVLFPEFKYNKYVLLFIAAIVGADKYRYAYGRQYRKKNFREHKIKLPVDENNNPDWHYMEDYISSLIDYSKIETKIKKKELPIDSSDWQYFRIGTLFAIQNCKCTNAGNLIDGDDIYYVGAKKNDNGIMKKVVYDSGLVTKGNCIIFICDGHGSVGYSNYMDIDFIGSTTLSVGYHAKLNKYTGLFLTAVLDLERPRYSYGRKYRKSLPETKIKLPTDKNGEPDWQFMENYIKSLPYSDKI
jgi:hypothetical protein